MNIDDVQRRILELIHESHMTWARIEIAQLMFEYAVDPQILDRIANEGDRQAVRNMIDDMRRADMEPS